MEDILCHFYKALEYLSNTAEGAMISRRIWKAGGLVKRRFIVERTKVYKYTIDYVSPEYSNIVVSHTYEAKPEDLLADDWYIKE